MRRPPEPAAGRHLLVALVVGQLGLHSAMAGLRMAAPLELLGQGHGAWAVGLLMALFAAAPVLVALPAGRLADRQGYHRPVAIAVASTAAGCLLAFASSWLAGGARFAFLCLAAMATGAGSNIGLLTIQRTASLAARDSAERVRIFSWLGVAPALSNVVGPVAAGFMIDAQGWRATYAMLLLLPLATLLAARQVPHRAALASAARVPGRRAWQLLADPALRRLFTVNWLLSMCWDVHTFAVPILGHGRGFSASTIGLVLGTFTLAVTGVRLLIPWLAHRLSAGVVLAASMLATALVFALYPLASTPLAMGTCAAVLGLALGSVQPMLMSMLHDLTPDRRHGEALALRSMAMNLSSAAMPLLFGAAGSLFGAAALFWIVGAAVGAGSWLTRRLRPQPSLASPQPGA